eukprot:scaffold2882_cov434-Prasinococcus_capsulatus_cf.AAC.3
MRDPCGQLCSPSAACPPPCARLHRFLDQFGRLKDRRHSDPAPRTSHKRAEQLAPISPGESAVQRGASDLLDRNWAAEASLARSLARSDSDDDHAANKTTLASGAYVLPCPAVGGAAPVWPRRKAGPRQPCLAPVLDKSGHATDQTASKHRSRWPLAKTAVNDIHPLFDSAGQTSMPACATGSTGLGGLVLVWPLLYH